MKTDNHESEYQPGASPVGGCVAFASKHPKSMLVVNLLLLAGMGYVLYRSHSACCTFAEQMESCTSRQQEMGKSIDALNQTLAALAQKKPDTGSMIDESAKLGDLGKSLSACSGMQQDCIKQIGILEQKVDSLASKLEEDASVKHSAAAGFLEAARKESSDTIKDALYLSAIAKSANKVPVLLEYINIQSLQVDDELKKCTSDISVPEDRLIKLATLCDTAINQGSVSDIQSVPEVQAALVAIKTKIDAKQKEIIEVQKNLLADWESKVGKDNGTLSLLLSQLNRDKGEEGGGAVRLVSKRDDFVVSVLTDSPEKTGEQSPDDLWQGCSELVAYLQTANFDVSLHDRRDNLITDIMNQAACLTPDDKPLEIPTVSDNTPWEAWLEHFVARVENRDVPSETVLQEIDEAGSFLTEAEKAGKGKGQLERISSIAKQHVASILKKKADDFLAQPGEPSQLTLATASQLMAECSAIPAENRGLLKTTEEKLFRYVMEESIKACDNSVDKVRYSYSMADSVKMSMYGAFQGQYAQLLQQLMANADKGYESYEEFKSVLSRKIEGLKDIQESMVKTPTSPTDRHAEQLRLYRQYAEAYIEYASGLYKKAEEIAAEWFKTWSNEECQNLLKDAWYYLMRIHPDDLRQADATLSAEYTELKNKIENYWPDYKKHLRDASGKARRISDM